MTEPQAPPLQQIAFAIGGSLVLHALLVLADFNGGMFKLGSGWSSGFAPLRVTVRDAMPKVVQPGKQAPSTESPITRITDELRIPKIAAPELSLPPSQPEATQPEPLNEARPPIAESAEEGQLSIPFEDPGFGTYRSRAEIDVQPQPLVQIEPKYPSGIVSPVPGRAVLLVLIGESGLVDQVRVLASEPTPAFGESAKAAFEQARYTPALLRNLPVPSYLTIEVNFG